MQNGFKGTFNTNNSISVVGLILMPRALIFSHNYKFWNHNCGYNDLWPGHLTEAMTSCSLKTQLYDNFKHLKLYNHEKLKGIGLIICTVPLILEGEIKLGL